MSDEYGQGDERRERCAHFCHKQGLNPWVKKCPTCGCVNPSYDPEAVADIEPSEWLKNWLGSPTGKE